jgi:hypothetical protein
VLQPRAATRGAEGDARVAQLLEQLTTQPSAFDAAALGGGPWQVVHTSGQLPWRAFTPVGAAAAAQSFDPAARTVVNSITLFDGAVRLTAEGTFTRLDARASTPARFGAAIRRGTLQLGALRVPLPIAGDGTFEVAFLQRGRLRVFRSAAGLAVQVPQALVAAADRRARSAGVL